LDAKRLAGCLLQLPADDQRVRLPIGSVADASFARVLRLYGLGSIGQSSWEHSSQPCASRAASREWPCSIADLIRRQRSQSGLSVIPAAPSWHPPDRQPIGSAGADRLFLYVIGCRRSESAQQELEEDADCPDQAFRRIQTNEGPPRKQEPGRAFDLPVHPRSGRSEQNKRRDARLHLDKSMLETSRHVTSLGPGVPMTDPRGCTMLRVVAISNANQNLRFARRTSTLRTVIGYHRLPPRRGGTWRRFNSLATEP